MKFKPGDKVVWRPYDTYSYKGVVVEYSGSDDIWIVDFPYSQLTYCYERHLTLVVPAERKRRGFASFVHRIEGN